MKLLRSPILREIPSTSRLSTKGALYNSRSTHPGWACMLIFVRPFRAHLQSIPCCLPCNWRLVEPTAPAASVAVFDTALSTLASFTACCALVRNTGPSNNVCNAGVCEKKPLTQAHKGEIGRPPGAQGVLPTNPRNWGEILAELFFERVWGETGLPKGLLGDIQAIWVAGNLMFSNLGPFPKQNHAFFGSHYCSKPRPGRVWNPIRDPGPEGGSEVPNVVPRA